MPDSAFQLRLSFKPSRHRREKRAHNWIGLGLLRVVRSTETYFTFPRGSAVATPFVAAGGTIHGDAFLRNWPKRPKRHSDGKSDAGCSIWRGWHRRYGAAFSCSATRDLRQRG